jgi:hypothetical protein
MRALVLNKKEEIRCVGDRLHNESLDVLFGGVKTSRFSNRIKFRLDLIYNKDEENVGMGWVPLTNTQCRKLNGIMKSKTEVTFQKRLQKYIHFLAYGTHYGSLFNKKQIEEFSKEIREVKSPK